MVSQGSFQMSFFLIFAAFFNDPALLIFAFLDFVLLHHI